jgi:hypothetical protein
MLLGLSPAYGSAKKAIAGLKANLQKCKEKQIVGLKANLRKCLSPKK